MKWADFSKYFKSHEFDSPDFPGSGELNMSLDLISKLYDMRELVNRPFIVTSGFRTPGYNKKVDGRPNSAHLRGLAADIACPDSSFRFEFLKAAYAVGIKRYEIAPHHIHVDIDIALSQKVAVFLPSYENKNATT